MTRSERVFRALLRLYPAAYRQDYGEPMLQLFRDQWRDASESGHSFSLLQLWIQTVGDMVTSAAAENAAAFGSSKMWKAILDLRSPNSNSRMVMWVILAFALTAAGVFLRKGLLEVGQPLWVAVLAVVTTMVLASVLIGYVMEARIGFYAAAALFIGVQLVPLFLVNDPTRWFNANPPMGWMIVFLGLVNQKASTRLLLLAGVLLGAAGVLGSLWSALA